MNCSSASRGVTGSAVSCEDDADVDMKNALSTGEDERWCDFLCAGGERGISASVSGPASVAKVDEKARWLPGL